MTHFITHFVTFLFVYLINVNVIYLIFKGDGGDQGEVTYTSKSVSFSKTETSSSSGKLKKNALIVLYYTIILY